MPVREPITGRYAREKKEAAAQGRKMQKPMTSAHKYVAFWFIVTVGGAEIECLIRGYPWAIVIAVVLGLIAVLIVVAKVRQSRK